MYEVQKGGEKSRVTLRDDIIPPWLISINFTEQFCASRPWLLRCVNHETIGR